MKKSNTLPRPSKGEISELPAFEGLPIDRIHLVRSQSEVEFATRKLTEARFIGFDTETKPTFTKEAVRSGPHVIQFATLEHAFIVQVGAPGLLGFLKDVIESTVMVKVGFGLKSDRAPLSSQLKIHLRASVDLSHTIRNLGYSQAVGVKAAVAIILGRKLAKPKSMTTSNWAKPELRPNQLMYAANDAHAALAVFNAMGRPYAPEPCSGVL